ncbi:ferric-dicitrate binding protein FerR (iron transport regulator) [Bacteroides reticulotermitis]|uniref:Ferric-dicitrate binding protein FerR (Iron transport regulator) n=1 Tax=Bacteroides reticulotermitis TaxID=1133319 RepID=A0A840CVI2_9BACE|nr:FecR domain-containing protein [Bacteroides reticulotermitis]MBB4042589.1 ferric-dicitrate binding protein FerR (iron transport regulator) [Bacteroides reticulotermitis]
MGELKTNRLIDKLGEADTFLSKYRHYRRVDKKKAWKAFCLRVEANPPKRINWQIVFRYAAILLLPISIVAICLMLLADPVEQKISESLAAVGPGTSQAILVLSDGNEISLDSTVTNRLAVGGTAVAAVTGSHISYQANSQATSMQYNTLLTKQGGEYRIVLEDGTKVHLNAASQLRYPVVFTNKERVVHLQGEAYFEVAPDKARPFYVVTDHMKIRQYGTAFNVNAYPGSSTEVVLVRGSIGVTVGDKERTLAPGQLAKIHAGSKLLSIKEVDTESYVAWNEGRFFFDNQSLRDIANVLSRWYNIEIQFARGDIQYLHFTGSLDRYDTIEPIIQAISRAANVKVEMKDHILYISK